MISCNKHGWTMEKDLLCCELYLEYYVVGTYRISVNQFVDVLQKSFQT